MKAEGGVLHVYFISRISKWILMKFVVDGCQVTKFWFVLVLYNPYFT
jgi:hypothetical protein